MEPHLIGLVSLQEETPELSVFPWTSGKGHVRTQQEGSVCKFPDTCPNSIFISDLRPPELDKIYFYSLSHAVRAILIWQLEKTNTVLSWENYKNCLFSCSVIINTFSQVSLTMKGSGKAGEQLVFQEQVGLLNSWGTKAERISRDYTAWCSGFLMRLSMTP